MTLPRLSAEGTHAAVSFSNPRTHALDVWSLDLERGGRRRETFFDRPGNGSAVWSPKRDWIAYSALIGDRVEIYVKKVDSSGNGEVLQTGLEGSKVMGDVSPDGRSIVYLFESDTGNENSIYGQSLSGGKPFFIAPGVADQVPRLSPDGHWVLFESNDSGSSEIVVKPFAPASTAATQVSLGGGHDPRWSRDGKELFYRNNSWQLIAVPVLDIKKSRFGSPAILFRLPENAEYDVVDGKRFLVNEPARSATTPLFVIANWRPEPMRSE